MSGAAVQRFMGRDKEGQMTPHWRGVKERDESGQMKFSNCDVNTQWKSSNQAVWDPSPTCCSSLLQGGSVPQYGLPRHCTHSCGIISSKCANMQNRPSKGLELKSINDYNIPNSPWAAQTAEHCCPNSSKGLARNSFLMSEHGEGKISTLQTLICSHLPTQQELDLSGSEGTEGEIFHLS